MATFRDNVVVLAGASRGIGEQIACQLADQGARLVLAARSAGQLEQVAQGCRQRGAEATAVPTDVTDESACQRLIQRSIDACGRIDTLLFNAGGGETRRFDALPDLTSARDEISLNYVGLVNCVYYALPHLKPTRGRIAAVSSMGGLIGLPGTAAYNGAKHAARGFLNSLRVELLGTGISVTIVYLGAVRTEGYLKRLGPRANSVPSVSPAQAAQSVIRAAAARRREVIPSVEGKLVAFLYPLIPGLLDRQLAKVGSLYEGSEAGRG